jgi:hypothetical protein
MNAMAADEGSGGPLLEHVGITPAPNSDSKQAGPSAGGKALFRDPRFDALRNAIYHTERRNFFDFLNRTFTFLVVVLGAGVAGKAAKLIHLEENWLELSIVVIASLQLVFDFASRARTHEFLQRRYYELLAEMEKGDLGSPGTREKWSAKLLTLAGEEPMTMRALDAIAYNKALAALESDPEALRQNRLRVTWLQRRLRHIFAFQAAEFPTKASISGKSE